MIPWLTRHPVTVWSLAWGTTALGFSLSNLSSGREGASPQTFLFLGLLAWGVAGALAFHRPPRHAAGFMLWAAAFLGGCGLAMAWMRRDDDLDDLHGPLSGLVVWALAMALAPLLGSALERTTTPWPQRLGPALLWAVMGAGGAVAAFFAWYFSLVGLDLIENNSGLDPWRLGLHHLASFVAVGLVGAVFGGNCQFVRERLLGRWTAGDDAARAAEG